MKQNVHNIERVIRVLVCMLQHFDEIQVVAVCDVNREGGGYLSWNWQQGTDLRLAGREPVRRMMEEYYAEQQGAGNGHRVQHGFCVQGFNRNVRAWCGADCWPAQTPERA